MQLTGAGITPVICRPKQEGSLKGMTQFKKIRKNKKERLTSKTTYATIGLDGGDIVLINDTTKDIKKLCIDQGILLKDLAERAGTSKQYVSRLLNSEKEVMNGMFIRMAEALGYDIEIRYVERSGEK